MSEELVLEPFPADHQRCSSCRQLKPEAAFFRMKRGRTAGQLSIQCRDCTAMYRRQRNENGKTAAYRMKRRSNSFAFMLQRNYGITVDEYKTMLADQDGLCAICKRPEQARPAPMKGPGGQSLKTKRLAVDHDHVTGRVRALLCSHCNAAIGHLHENPVLARAAANYLERFAASPRAPAIPTLSWRNCPF